MKMNFPAGGGGCTDGVVGPFEEVYTVHARPSRSYGINLLYGGDLYVVYVPVKPMQYHFRFACIEVFGSLGAFSSLLCVCS